MRTTLLIFLVYFTLTIQDCLCEEKIGRKNNIRKLRVSKPVKVPLNALNYTWNLRNKGTNNKLTSVAGKQSNVYKGANFTGKTPDGKFVAKKQYIISGMLSYRGQFPFIAGLDIDDDFFCGGSLITRIHVLTAAHCCSDSKKYDVYLGAQNIDADEAGRTLMTSYRKVFHHQFNPDSLVNDIAIVFLPKAATLTNYIKLIRLPTAAMVGNSFLGQTATIAGWGRTSDKKPEVSDVMYNIELNIVPLAECMKTYGSDSVFNTNICSASRGIQATCQGDSGGPLVIRDSNNQWMQVGLVSYGAASGCEEGYPDVFTRLTPFLPWIKKTVSVPFVGMSNGALKKKPNRAFNPVPNKRTLNLKQIFKK